MLGKNFPLIFFTLLFLLIANWHLFHSTFTVLYQPTGTFTAIQDPELTRFIQERTGTTISSFYVVASDSLFAGMSGLPSHPIMTLSQALYDSFPREELHYIVLHETGHLVLLHTLQEILLQLAVLVVSLFALNRLQTTTTKKSVLAMIAAIFLGVAVIQVTRLFEWQADTYALKHLENPQSMISATKKLESAWKGPGDDSLLREMFYRGIPYSERIEHAENFRK
jgi:Zn-dependent protease with chaperone function